MPDLLNTHTDKLDQRIEARKLERQKILERRNNRKKLTRTKHIKRRQRKRKHLTTKDRTMIKHICEGMEPKEAAKEVGYSEGYVNSNIETILAKPAVKAKFTEIMEKIGLDDETLALALKDGITANKVISAVVTKTKLDPELEDANGASYDFVEVPDYTNRHRFLKTALDLKDKFPDRKIKVEARDVTLEALILELRQSRDNNELDITPEIDKLDTPE